MNRMMHIIAAGVALSVAFVANATDYTWSGGGNSTSITDAGNWGGTAGDAVAFTASDTLTIGGAATIAVGSDVTVGSITLASPVAVSFEGLGKLTVTSMVSTGTGTTTFGCPVQFSDTYNVTQNGIVQFPGGVTATYPDNALRTDTSTENTRTLRGTFNFTADWTVNRVGDYPWIVPAGSVVRGQKFTGTQTGHHRILRVEEGGEAYFSDVTIGWDIGDIDIEGYLEVSGDMSIQTRGTSSDSESHFGRDGNGGTLKANRIQKIGHSRVASYIPNLIVGAGGIGVTVQDHFWIFKVDTTVTAAENFDFLGLQYESNKADWGIYINGSSTLTINVPEGLTVTCGIGINGVSESHIRKVGAGTLVMTDTYNGTSGYVKNFGSAESLLGSMIVEEGTLKVEASGQLGGGAVWLATGTRMEVSPNVTLSNRIDGNGTVQLANGVTIANGGAPWRAAAVEFATQSDAVTVTAPDGTAAPFVFLTGVGASDLSRFTYADGTLSVKGGALTLADSAAATDYVWNGGASGDWSAAANWLVGGAAATAAPGSSDTIRFDNDEAVTVTGTEALAVTKVVTTSGALVTFSCPVQFAGTYNVVNAATAPNFAGGATATVPDSSLTGSNIPSHELKGAITFTEDWTVPTESSVNPFILTANSTLNGKTVTAAEYSNVKYHLRIDKNAVATFTNVAVNAHFVFKLNGGRLVSTGDLTMWKNDCGQYLDNNVGTVEANGIYKSVNSAGGGKGNINFYVTDMLVGSGGFGMLRRDYNLVFQRSSKLTAKADLKIHYPLTSDGASDGKNGDWGLNLNGRTFTIDTAGHTVTFDSWVANNASKIIKEGEGEMIMQSFLKQHTGGTILKGGLTTVKLAGALGQGSTIVNSGATLAFADGAVSHAYPITVKSGGTLVNSVTVGDTSTLTLEAGAVLKPAQNAYFDLSSGSLVLPGAGTVTLDISDFQLVNGVKTPLLAGLADGDLPKFTVLAPSGVVGSLSITDGILSYTATSGGSAAASLFWNGGDNTWSTEVAAWTNAAGEQVVFTDYANATVYDGATIAIPSDVTANDITIAADADVTLNGAGKIGGPGSIVKSGTGTLTFNATGGLDVQPIIISNGVFKIGEDLSGQALGASGDTSPVVVAPGGTLDVNYNDSSSDATVNRNMVTRDKLIHIAGEGYNGQGVIVNNNQWSSKTFSDIVLDEDATIGGSKRMDVRNNQTAYTRSTTSIYGPGKTLSIMNTDMFAIVDTPSVTLDAIVVTNNGVLRAESNCGWSLTRGVLLRGGKISTYNTSAFSPNVVAESGDNYLYDEYANHWSGYTGTITVNEGATLTQTGGNLDYKGTVNGTVKISGGQAVNYGTINGAFAPSGGTLYLAEAPTENLTIAGEHKSEIVKLRHEGTHTYTGANIECYAFGVSDVENKTVSATFLNSTLNIDNFYLGWGSTSSGHVTLGEGTTLTTAKISIGDTGTSTSSSISSSFTVDGGTLNLTNTDFFVAHNGPHSTFTINSGVANVVKAIIRLRCNNQALGGYNTSEFIQNGGTFNYGGAGFTANFEDNSEDGQIVLKGGVFNATTNWSIPHYISTCFKSGVDGGWTLNQTAGTTATWNTAIKGDGDVTLNGAATLVGDKEIQGVVAGKWTLGAGFKAGLEGAASILGGLAIGEGAEATVDIATNRSAVFTARDFGDRDLSKAESLVGRFNAKVGGSTHGTITHNETHLFKFYNQADRPFGNMNYSAAYAVGQFYVEADAAGDWSFSGKCDDRVALWIDGELVMRSTGDCKTVSGSKTLAAGWHSFRHVISDNSGGFGGTDYFTVGYKDGSGTMSNFARFNVENLKMRPAADMGDPNNANTVRWSHYKGSSSTVTADTFKNDFDWDFRCITNNLQMLQTYTKTDTTYLNTYTVNRFEGWFLVTEENADKTWTFRSQYDDRCAMWVDGVDTGLTGADKNTLTYAVTLSRGWHRFRIQSADFTGSAGPWGNKGLGVSYQVADGSQTQFSEATLDITVCPDGYVQGGVTLAKDATLTNGVSESAAVIYGDVTVTGTGAKITGPFKFEGGTLSLTNVSSSVRNLSGVLAFENYAPDMFANIGGIVVDFESEMPFGRIVLGPAAGLSAESAKEKVSVTVSGEEYTNFEVTVQNDNIVIEKRGFFLLLR